MGFFSGRVTFARCHVNGPAPECLDRNIWNDCKAWR